MCLQFLERYRHWGFIILRVGIGIMFIYHGSGKVLGGPETWTKIGSAMAYLGINFAHTFFGLLAVLSEFLGGICFILGLLFRPACFFLFFTMTIAATMHLCQGDGLPKASHAIEAGILFLSFMFIGPGPYNLDEKIKHLCKNNQ